MYVVLGATGNTGKTIAENLLKAGKQVKAIGRSADKLQSLKDLGAELAIGDQADATFLSTAFKGATAAYVLIPPSWVEEDFRAYQNKLGNAVVEAVNNSGLKNLVLLSSIGAHNKTGAGVVMGLGDLEDQLKTIEGLNTLSLRAGFFFENIFGSAQVIKNMGVYGGFPLKADSPMAGCATIDIANAATEGLLTLDFKGFNVQYVAGPRDITMNDIAAAIGKAIGKEVPYVQFSDDDVRASFAGMGASKSLIENYIEFSHAWNSGLLADPNFKRDSKNTTPTSIEWYAENVFAPYFKTL